ncbi:hypothetical protein CKO35_10170 [Ectothiorhodospira shaposhnikovii]|uniref:hypothetical protein n=1 Tax=Ectothiorhodospira shaposhnikovii TaxID=1054 RepID=UPI001904A6F4|nr:hypothetical protein [Ectothiorhodospira shaposhnikovii]MBK1673666.1 hypothetical protein [Ectothiorhodospira shaposhnikovii]
MAVLRCRFGEIFPGGRSRDCVPRCWFELEKPWLDRAVKPYGFKVFQEHEVMARRVLGHDRAGTACFHAYDYQLTEPRSDDDMEFYAAVTYAESLVAWRLLDGRWLVRHQVMPFGDEGEGSIQIRLTRRMP